MGDKKMLKIGEKVVYLSKRILIISDIIDKDFGMGDLKKYYVLKDVNDQNNAIYLPVDSELAVKNIRPLLTKKMINKAIDESARTEVTYESAYKDRVNKYNELIKENNVSKMLSVIYLLLQKKNELLAMKKTLTNIDANCLQDLIRAITDEFSCVLKISKEEVLPYIEKRIAEVKR